MCDTCYQLVYTAGRGVGNHTCPDVVLAKRDAELDSVIEAELETWDYDVNVFWGSKDVKFWDYLLRTKKEI